jgi:HEPN domain-containing protein
MKFVEADAEMADASAAQTRVWRLLDSGDYSGAIEAAQHCIEHAIKSLYKLVGLDPPRTHDAVLEKRGQDTFVHVARRLSFPDEQQFLRQQFLRLRWIGPMWSWANNTAVYGYEGIPAATFFYKEDAELARKFADEAMIHVSNVIAFCRSGDIKIGKNVAQNS